jgi:hypothetical protein
VPDIRSDIDLKTLSPLIKNIDFFRERKIKEKDFVDICQ